VSPCPLSKEKSVTLPPLLLIISLLTTPPEVYSMDSSIENIFDVSKVAIIIILLCVVIKKRVK
jgi:hypothetical protein